MDLDNKDNKNLEEELDTASEAKAGEEDIPENADAQENGQELNEDAEDGLAADGEAAEETQESTGAAETNGTEVKSGFFGKKKKDKKEEAFKVKIEELEDRVKRQMAEFDNFRKRTDREKSAMFETGAKSVIEKILPVVDNFERGLAAVPEGEKDSAFVDGMNKVYKQLMTELDNIGVKPIEAVGTEFNPDFHNAVMHVEDDNEGENVIVEEFQKGYTYHESVVRHSMVKVAN